MPRTLLVDTNRASYPIYQALIALGHEVWTVGGNPQETLAKLSKNYVKLDYSDVDKLSTLINNKNFDYIVPGCTDLSYKVCSEISNGIMPGIETKNVTSSINNKNEFRELANKLGLPVPRVLSLKNAEKAKEVIVKPTDSFSGRGMSIIKIPTRENLSKAYKAACNESKTGNVVIEEFVTGQLFSHSAFIKNHEVVVDFIVQEDCVANPFAVDTSRVFPWLSKIILDKIRKDIHALASFLNLKDGLIHTQFIANKEVYWIIEMTRRCPGDIYSLLIEFTTSYPYAAAYAAPFIEHEIPYPDIVNSFSHIIRHTVSSRNEKNLWGLSFLHPVHIRLFVPLLTSGDILDKSPYGRAGIVFLQASSQKEQNELYQMLLSEELYTIG